jgi:hypothetical protein
LIKLLNLSGCAGLPEIIQVMQERQIGGGASARGRQGRRVHGNEMVSPAFGQRFRLLARSIWMLPAILYR